MISILCHVTCYEQSLIRCSPDQPTVPQTFLLTNFQFLPVFLSSLFLSLRVMLGTPGVIFHETHNVCTLRMHNNAATHLTHGAHRCRDSAMGIKMICTLTFSKKVTITTFSRPLPVQGKDRPRTRGVCSASFDTILCCCLAILFEIHAV